VSSRAAGLLLHPTSLPGRFGVGDLGPAADRFLEWLQSAGLSLWQMLPVVPTGLGDSPYGGLSAFAGNPLLLSPERLVEDGLLVPSDLEDAPVFLEERFDSDRVRAWKEPLLRRAGERFRSAASPGLRQDFESFRSGRDQAPWLSDWSSFAALSSRFPHAPWTAWPGDLARREPGAIDAIRRELAEEIEHHELVQFLFFRQWARMREEARRRGVRLIGDAPIYVSHHSAEVWAHRELFLLDERGAPEAVAGVPPDYFSATGQLWGYPLYRWNRMEKDGFAWWIARFRAGLRQCDLVRVDHFRGFASFWAVPAGARSAAEGSWVEGPGRNLFDALRDALGGLPLIAEDLGTITEDVVELLAALALPGMRVLQFAFSDGDSTHLPHRHVRNAVVYTGTHDNDTARGWFGSLPEEARRRALDYLGSRGDEIEWDLIRAAFTSVADRAIAPAQDVFSLDSAARMNTPARAGGNWAWRAQERDFTAERAARLRRLAQITGRLRAEPPPSPRPA